MPISPCPGSDRYQTLPPLFQYISSPLTSSSQKEEDDNLSVVVKQEEREGDEEEKEEEIKPSRKTRKRKFYLNQVSKKRDADISYHQKKTRRQAQT